MAAALFDHRERLSNAAGALKVAEEKNGIGEITDIYRCLRDADEAMLRKRDERSDALLAQEGEQLMQLHGEELLVRHRVEETVDAVDDHDAQILLIDQAADPGDELARRQLSRIDLLNLQRAVLD